MAEDTNTTNSSDCSVYVIGFDIGKGPSKVGISGDPLRRMASLQTSHHQRLVLAGWWKLPDREAARNLEASFHAVQKDKRLSGEWFDIPPNTCMVLLMLGLGVMLNHRYGLEPSLVNEVIAFSRNDYAGIFE